MCKGETLKMLWKLYRESFVSVELKRKDSERKFGFSKLQLSPNSHTLFIYFFLPYESASLGNGLTLRCFYTRIAGRLRT